MHYPWSIHGVSMEYVLSMTRPKIAIRIIICLMGFSFLLK